MALAIITSIVASCLFGIGASLQRKGVITGTDSGHFSLKSFKRLVMQPTWIVGTAMGIAGSVLQLVALRYGSLLLVMPLLAVGLVIALGFDATMTRVHMPPKAWIFTALTAAGTAVFVVAVGNSKTTAPHLSSLVWISAISVTIYVALWHLPGRHTRAPWIMGLGGGIIFAATSALAKAAVTSTGNLHVVVVHALASWTLYGAICLGTAGTVLLQHAYGAGPLAKSLPINTVIQPVAGVFIGMWSFHERFGTDTPQLVAGVASLAVTLAVIWLLTRSVVSLLPADQAPTD